MRILLLNDDFPAFGGKSSVATVALDLSREYVRLGHEVTVLTSHRKEFSPEILRKDGCVSVPVSYRPSLRQYRSLYSSSTSTLLQSEIAKIKPDVVHAHNVHMYLTYDALRIAKKYAPKVFVTLHDVMSFSYWRLSTPRYLSAARDARLSIADHFGSAGLQYNPIRNMGIRRTFTRNVDQVFAVSKALQDALTQNSIGNTTVVHNGIDLPRWTPPSVEELSVFQKKYDLTGKKVILFGGRLSTDKGSTPILKAIDTLRREFPDVVLLVVGENSPWEIMLKASGLPNEVMSHCRLTGWLDRKDIRTAFFTSSIVTTPSLCLDCFPSTNLEAMATGLPIVGTVFGGTPEAVTHGETGFVCDPRNSAEYEGYLRQLLQDSALRERMGKTGKERARSLFSTQKQAEAYLGWYKR